jgi:hypothetical protein
LAYQQRSKEFMAKSLDADLSWRPQICPYARHQCHIKRRPG